jgi:hypothetical protein
MTVQVVADADKTTPNATMQSWSLILAEFSARPFI